MSYKKTHLCTKCPADVYLQDGRRHALGDRAVDQGEAPSHDSVELLLAPLLGQEDPRRPAKAAEGSVLCDSRLTEA